MIKLYIDPEKILNREKMIFSNYYSITGRKTIPCDRKYFTLAGPCIDDFGNIICNTEIDHLLKKSFITKDQLISFENEFSIHNRNSKYKGPIWLQQDISKFNFSYLNKNEFPAIINFDSCDYFPKGLQKFKNIINSLDKSNIKDVYVIFNSILDYNHRLPIITMKEAQSKLNLNKNWIASKFDCYKGSSSRTVMGTFSFYRK